MSQGRLSGSAGCPLPQTLLECFKSMCFLLQTLKNSKSLCSLDYEDDEDDTGVKTAVSSPCDPHGLTGLLTPRPRPASPSPSCGDPSDEDSAGEEALLPLDHGELDLEQIENN